MNTLNRIQEIALRLDHLDSAGEWLSRALENVDTSASQTGSLVTSLSEDIRQRLFELVSELEKQLEETRSAFH